MKFSITLFLGMMVLMFVIASVSGKPKFYLVETGDVEGPLV